MKRKLCFFFLLLFLLIGCTKEPAPQEEVQTCTLSVSCAAALEYGELDAAVRKILPDDGWLLPQTEVSFSEGESVFDVLLRQMQEHGIPMEFEQTPMFQTAYIEGIGGLYEFACGDFSGWVYSVNGESLNVGCSNCAVHSGDKIVWEYIWQ